MPWPGCAPIPRAPGAAALPDALSVFGPTRLPQAHLEVLHALAAHRQVHLWLVHPSPGVWRSVSDRARPTPRRRDSPVVARHPLLASMARDTVELQQRVVALAEQGQAWTDTHHEGPTSIEGAPAPGLLGALQASLRTDDALTGVPAHALATDDRSIQVHSCHGRARQVEVLREVVLGLLADDPSLQPRDILVMCPDVEAFAPVVTGAFGLASPSGQAGPGRPVGSTRVDDGGTHPGQLLRIRLADRSLRQTNPCLSLIATMLELATGRVEASAVLDLAASEPVRHRFGFTEDDLDRIRAWAVEVRVRWGENASRRERFGVGHVLQGTWRVALDRILLGAAMAEDEPPGWVGAALPLDDVDSLDVDLAGRLAEFIGRLELLLQELTGVRPASAWMATLGRMLDLLASTGAGEGWQEVQARQVIADVAGQVDTSGGERSGLRLGDVRALLAGRLAGRPTRAGFRTGALTVCSLEPMRAVPHRVVCLIGMDDGFFPRSAPAAGDDLLLRDPFIGERDRRSEDRQLFLDALTAAREHLVLIYSGADPRTGAARPPAVPVGEMLDALEAVARTDDGATVREHVVVRHPLHPEDVRNFRPGALGRPGPFSFDVHARDAAAAVAALSGERVALATGPSGSVGGRLLERPLPPRPHTDEDLSVDLDDLIAVLEHPARWFLRHRLGVWVRGDEDDVEDRIPLELDPLAIWGIGDRLLTDCLAGVARDQAIAAERRRGRIPPRALGRAVLDRVEADLAPVALAAQAQMSGSGASVDLSVDLPGERRLTGSVPGVHDGVVVRAVFSRLGPKHRLRAWVQTLALAASHTDRSWAAATTGRGRGGRSVALTATVAAPSAAIALHRLTDLVRLRERALREPLPMPVATAAAYARARDGGETVEQAEAAAAAAWTYELKDDAHLELCWGERAPVGVLLDRPSTDEQAWAPQESSRLGVFARRVWDPLLAVEQVSTR